MKHTAIKRILEMAPEYDWSIQGFGMLRLYLSDAVRLHVWDKDYMVPDVSLIHTHPWDFQSEVISGTIRNIKYVERPLTADGAPHNYATILCGPGGGMKSEYVRTNLAIADVQDIRAGEIYCQRADEIHESQPSDGSVTLVTRTFKGDKDHAKVYWEADKQWVSAEPRAATYQEVMKITRKALRRMEDA